MPSLALGKLLSSNNTKTNGAHDASSKKPRVRSLSEKRLNDASQVAKLPTPPNIDRFTSDSYFAAAKKRTPKDGNYNETDDYGFPVVDRLHLQQIADDMQELSKTMLKGKCRTCNKAFQAPAMSVWTCDQCYTANGISSGASRGDMDRPVKPLSASKTQDTIDQLIEHGLKTLESMKPDGLEVPGSPQNGHGDWERPSRRSALGPTRPPGPLTQRRGSAPDISRPNLQFQNGTTDGRPSIEGRPKQAIRRKSPGPISFQGGRGPRSSTHGSPVIGPANGFNGEPPSPFLNSESCSPKFPSESFPRRPRVDMNRDPFQPLLDYLSQISKRPNLNISFSTIRGHHHGRSTGDPNARSANKGSQDTRSSTPPPQISQMDHKDLMIGDVYDVASSLVTEQSSPSKRHMSKPDPLIPNLVSHGSPHIDWRNLGRWYETVLAIGLAKKDQPPANNSGDSSEKPSKTSSAKRAQILEDLGHVVRGHILELMEHLLAIPQQAPSEPQDIRYLLILLANPLLTSSKDYPIRSSRRITLPAAHEASSPNYRQRSPSRGPQRGSHNLSKKSRVLSLLMGVIANLPSDCHTYIIQWLSRYPEDIFRKHVDMLLTFVNERVSIRGLFQKSSRKSLKSSSMYHGVPTSQMFDDLLQSDMLPGKDVNVDDWQLQSACKVLQLFVRANDIFQVKSGMNRLQASSTTRRRPVVKQLIHTEYFYISQLDSEDKLDAARDFDDWERKEPGLQLTRYSFLLTLGTKMRILEADGRKKMASKARQEFFDSIMRHTSVDKFFHLKVRRTCVIEDSLQRISEAISSSEGEAKKALKVHFEGEEGIDAGGLRKEWFLLLVRELLDPALGKFKDHTR
jgi:E3 ubiquitin-protein ligase HECTD2